MLKSSLKRHAEVLQDSGSDKSGCTIENDLKDICSKYKHKPKNKSTDEYDSLACSLCGSPDMEEEMLLCDKCDEGFHMHCVRPILVSIPNGDWFCSKCNNEKKIKEFPLVQTKIIDFFKIKRSLQTCETISRKKRKMGPVLSMQRRRRVLLPYRSSPNSTTRLVHMASLATALTSVGAEYSDELKLLPGVRRRANAAQMEVGGMQKISPEDYSTYLKCREMQKRGEVPPLIVKHDPLQGFTVEADSHIADWTLISEYTGEVDYFKNRVSDSSDSLMTLLNTGSDRTDLVICPHRFANVARFFSGINNHTPDGRRKINVRCVRFDIDGEPHVLLIAIKDIRRGDRLYYDYNGLHQDYPTFHFD